MSERFPVTEVPLCGKMICETEIPLATRRTKLVGVTMAYWDGKGYYQPIDVYRALKKDS